MALILDEDFEGGANGVTFTAVNTAFTSLAGTPTFDNSWFVTGAQSMLVNPAAVTEYGIFHSPSLRATSGIRFYLRFAALPAAATYLVSMNAFPSTVRAQIRINTAGTLGIRNATTLVATTTAVLAINTTYRIEWALDNGAGTQQLKVFNLHDAAALSGGDITGAYNVGTHDDLVFGIVQSGTWTANFDALKLDDTATFIGPAVSTSNWTYGYDVVIGG